jgi:hypothetical protein
MQEDLPEQVTIDTSELERLVGKDVIAAILAAAPLKVQTRVAKAAQHLQKAIRLQSFDDEMGAIRLIAAEEELVVAIFEWLKLNSEHFPEYRDFVSKMKNHLVKLTFTPVLGQMATIFDNFLKDGLAPAGLQDVITWRVEPGVKDGKVVLQLFAHDGKHLLDVNPLDVSISRDDVSEEGVVQKLYDDFRALLPDGGDNKVKSFITNRADYRNKLLYADDGQSYSMAETLEEIRHIIERDLKRLLWCLAALLTNQPLSNRWGGVGQFIALYRRVLLEAKVLRTSELAAFGLAPSKQT